MKKLLIIPFLLLFITSFSQQGRIYGRKNHYGIFQFFDSVYFNSIPYSESASIVHLGIDTNVLSPTFGKLVRKTAGGSTPTLQQVFDTEVGGSILTKMDTINVGSSGSEWLKITGAGSGLTLQVLNTGSGKAINASSVSGTSMEGNSSSGLGMRATTVSGTAAGEFSTGASSGSNIVTVANFYSQNQSGAGANGLGGQLLYGAESSTTVFTTASRFQWYYTNATHANRTVRLNWLAYSNALEDTVMTLGDYVALTESSATKFTSTTIATGKIQGGSILITIEANDATDYQSRTLRFIWSAVNKAGTLTITLGTPEEVVALSSGTLTCTITAVDAGSGVLDFKANAVSSLTQSTLRATYQTFKNF